MLNKSLKFYLDQYGESHQNKLNQSIHKIAVPLIMFSILGLLLSIPMPVSLSYHGYLTPASILAFLGFLFYAHFSLPVAIIMLAWALLDIFILEIFINIFNFSNFNLFLFSLIIFILSWIAQFVGHYFEKKKPSFFEDLFFLLIGPLWVIRKFLKI